MREHRSSEEVFPKTRPTIKRVVIDGKKTLLVRVALKQGSDVTN